MRRVVNQEHSVRRIGGSLVFALAAALALAACAQTGNSTDTSGMAPMAPEHPQAGVMNVADAAISGGDPTMALKVSQAVLADDPKNLDALYHEGAAYYAINRCMDSVAVYKVALTVNPASSEAQTGIGRCLLRRNAPQAEQAFGAAVQDDPQNAAALNDLGVARDLQGNHAGAVDPYQQALLIDPGNVATEVNLGMSLALSGHGDDALQYLGPLASSTDATPKIREDYAAALMAAGREQEARQVLAVDLAPDQVDVLIADFSQAIAAGMTPPPPPALAQTAAPAAAPQAEADTAAAPIAPVVNVAAAPIAPAAADVAAPMPVDETPTVDTAAPAVAPVNLPAASMSGGASGAPASTDQVIR